MAGVEIPEDESQGDTSMVVEEDEEYNSPSEWVHNAARRLDPEFQVDLTPPHEAVDLPLPPSPTQRATSPISINSTQDTPGSSTPPTSPASLDPRNATNTGLAEATTP